MPCSKSIANNEIKHFCHKLLHMLFRFFKTKVPFHFPPRWKRWPNVIIEDKETGKTRKSKQQSQVTTQQAHKFTETYGHSCFSDECIGAGISDNEVFVTIEVEEVQEGIKMGLIHIEPFL